MPVTVHTFGDTRHAYNASQCWYRIKDGDILYVPSERVVGFLFDVAWPVAITEAHGEFGKFTCGEGTPEMLEIRARYPETFALAESIRYGMHLY